jgi:DNA-binding MarR family transcriptional regulator
MAEVWLSDEQQRIWRSYLRMESLLPARLNRQLQSDSGLSIAEYAVLVPLSESSEGRLRPFELGITLNWEQSRLSHQLMRMQNRGLIRREQCPSDRRGAFVVLTDDGRAAIEAAAPGHVNAVRRLVFDQLSPEQATALGEACAAIVAALETDSPECCS